MKKIISGLSLSSLSYLITMGMVWAAAPGAEEITHGVDITKDRITDILESFRDWFAGIVAIIGVIMILWGAFVYMTAAGNEERAGSGKKTILYGAIGVAIALVAYGVFGLIRSFLG